MKNTKIGYINVGLSTNNLGDKIISQACGTFLKELKITSKEISSHIRIPLNKFNKYSHIEKWLVGGSNIIGNRPLRVGQLPINLASSLIYKPKLLMLGCGWIDNRTNIDIYSKVKIKLLYGTKSPHSVRDSKTLKMLKNIGYKNIINTGCPTLWYLPKNINEKINKFKGENCIFTLTDYRKSPYEDSAMIDIIYRNFQKIYFWPQGSYDEEYLVNLYKKKYISSEIINSIKIIRSSLEDYEKFLSEEKTDYIGTRLHGGIKAIQKGKRTIIIGIDNRANNIANDNNLLVLKRELVKSNLENIINNEYNFNIKIQNQEITRFKFLFKKYLDSK